MKNRLKAFGVIALIAVMGFSMITCDNGVGGEETEKPDNTNVGDKTKYVMNISDDSDWDYLVFCEDGSSMVYNVNENTGIPTIAYVKPQKDSDKGFTFLFKEDGLPHMMVFDGYVFYFSNFNGYTFDMAAIHPDYQSRGRYVSSDYMQFCNNIEVDMDWNLYNKMLMHDFVWDPLFKTVSAYLDVLGKALGTVVCATATLACPPTVVGCGIFILNTGTGIVVEIAEKRGDMSSTAKDALQTVLSGLGCALLDPVDCISTATGILSMMAEHDLAKLVENANETAEARKGIEGSKNVAVTGVTTNGPISVAVGYSKSLGNAYTISPDNATEKYVIWSSSNSSIATVKFGTELVGVAPGTTTLTVDTYDGNKKATCTVTVTTPINVNGVTLNKTWTTLVVGGDPEKLTASVLPTDATNKIVYWDTSNPGIARVDDYGFVTPVAPGIATITVTTKDGNYTATCTVTVTIIPVTGVNLDKTTHTMAPHAEVNLYATVLPSQASDKRLEWTSSDTSVATVQSNDIGGCRVIAGYTGTADVTVRTVDGNYTATCVVTVTTGSTEPTDSIIEMVRIPAGTFTMGAPQSESYHFRQSFKDYSDERPQHQVTLSAFSMSKYVITQKQWFDIMGTTISQATYYWLYKEDLEIGGNYPMTLVTWYDAVEFCNRLSEAEGLTPYYTINKTVGSDSNNVNTSTLDPKWLVTCNASANGYRLPTEAQWEYACRAGTTTPYNTGDTITKDQANFDNENWDFPNLNAKPVGTYAPNAWGLYDMHGNVAEWCWDWFGEYYSSVTQTNPTGPSSGIERVLRGGSWYNEDEYDVSSGARFGKNPTVKVSIYDQIDRCFYMGFRVVRP